MDFEEGRILGVEAIEVDTFHENHGTYELRVGRAGVSFERNGNGMVQRVREFGNVAIHYEKGLDVAHTTNWERAYHPED